MSTRDSVSGSSFLLGSSASGAGVWTSEPATQTDLLARHNYWGTIGTGEILSSVNPRNLSVIDDFYDNVELAEVDYADWATTAFPMPRVTAPRWWYEYQIEDTATFTGYGNDYEDAATAGCADASASFGM
ncbi:MAG: hypothetical protein JW751_11770 [Polyangiaceae bacterium]|nr:hypothetical protein [Polyangiaceae bacterium]